MRTCTLNDLPALLDFYQLVINETEDISLHARWVYGQHPTEEAIRTYVEQGNMYCLEDGTTIVAAAAVTPYQTEDYHGINWQIALKDDEVAVVHILAVNPRFRRQGCAKAIMRDVVRLANSKGLKAVRLDALACNTPAHQLYASMGFQKRDVRHWYAENTGWYDFYLFEYLLKETDSPGFEGYTVKYNDLTAEQFIEMRTSVWGYGPSPEQTALAMEHSLFRVSVFDGDKIVAMARMIGDLGLCYYIKDVVVRPEYQRQGLGTLLMRELLSFIRRNGVDETDICAELCAMPDKIPFYERFGFSANEAQRLRRMVRAEG